MNRRYIVSCGCGRATAFVHATKPEEAVRIAIRRLGKYSPDDCTATVNGDNDLRRPQQDGSSRQE